MFYRQFWASFWYSQLLNRVNFGSHNVLKWDNTSYFQTLWKNILQLLGIFPFMHFMNRVVLHVDSNNYRACRLGTVVINWRILSNTLISATKTTWDRVKTKPPILDSTWRALKIQTSLIYRNVTKNSLRRIDIWKMLAYIENIIVAAAIINITEMSISHVLNVVAEFNPPAAISASLCSKAASVTKENQTWLKIPKISHSTLRAKRATFTIWFDRN